MVYHRCPNCQSLMNIDPKLKLQRCKYCGTECTEIEARGSYDDGASSEWKKPRTELPCAQARTTQQSGQTGEAKYTEQKNDKPKVGQYFSWPVAIIICLILIAVLAVAWGIRPREKKPVVQDLRVVSMDGEVELIFPKAVVEEKESVVPPTEKILGANQQYADRAINYTSEDDFFQKVIFANTYYWGAVFWDKEPYEEYTENGLKFRRLNYGYYPASQLKKTTSKDSYPYGRELFLKDDHYFSVYYFDYYGHRMVVDELALYVRVNDEKGAFYITFPSESRNNSSISLADGTYFIRCKGMIGMWDYYDLRRFYVALSDSYCRIDDEKKVFYVKIRRVGEGGLTDRVAKVEPVRDGVEVTVLEVSEGRKVFE